MFIAAHKQQENHNHRYDSVSMKMPSTTKATIAKIPPPSTATLAVPAGTTIRGEKRQDEPIKEPINIRRTRSALPSASYSKSKSASALLTHTQKSFTPITAHYDLNSTLYDAFLKIYDKRRYKLALAIGLQFCKVSLFDIPTHGYYNSPKYHHLKIDSAKKALYVSDILCKNVIVLMVREEQKEHKLSQRKEGKKKGKNSNTTSITTASDVKNVLPSDLIEKIEEAKLLNEVATENMQLVQSTSKSSPALLTPRQRRGKKDKHHLVSGVGKEVVHVEEEDDIPSWLRILDCGNSESMIDNLCSSSSKKKNQRKESNTQLTSVKEEVDTIDLDQNSTTGNNNKEQEQERILSPLKEQLKTRYGNEKLLQPEISRTISAPAGLGNPPTPTKSKKVEDNHRRVRKEKTQENMSSFLSSNKAEVVQPNNETMTKTKEDAQFESDLERALYLSGLEFQSTTSILNQGKYSVHSHKHLKKIETDELDVQTLSSFYKEDFDELRKVGQIDVSFVDTYQGRIPGSLNGCTVIAPLLAIHHLCDENVLTERSMVLMEGKSNYSDRSEQYLNPAEDEKSEQSSFDEGGINNDTVRAVIDIQAPIILPKVREGLGLRPDALIIPSDVHDYLMTVKMLQQSQFVDVCSGNILDDTYLNKFIDTLAGTDNTKTGEVKEERKLAATFFFHEHVVSIHSMSRRIYINDDKSTTKKKTKKSRLSRFKRNKKSKKPHGSSEVSEYPANFDNVWFEIIDSLPSTAMLGNNSNDSNSNNNNKKGTHKSKKNEYEDSAWMPNTARIRCYGKKSLRTALRWYASSKFAPDDQKFINTYQWDHKNVNFDPRVFQGFIWSE